MIVLSMSSVPTQSLGQFVWMKTIPLLIYIVPLPFLFLIVAKIIDFRPISEPLAHYLSKLIISPVICIVAIISIAVAHILIGRGVVREEEKQ